MRQTTGAARCAAARRGGTSRLLLLSALMALAVAATAPAAVASPNNQPSKSAPVSVGIPFTGNWPGTVHVHGNAYNHWWRLPATVRPGDSIQLAVDNRLSEYNVRFCLIPPIDDFDADEALSTCQETFIGAQRQDRVQMTYSGSSGQAHLAAYILSCCGTAASDTGQYTVTVERIVTRVVPGLVVPGTVPAAFTISAPLRYGDNVPVGPGVGAVLQWRYRAARGRKPAAFANLATASSAGGAATFAARLPATARGRRIQLRACAAQPGGTTLVCTAAQNTLVQAGPSPSCVAAKALRSKRGRAVTRLKVKARRAHGRSAKRSARRKLRKAKRRLAASRRAVRINC